MSETTSSKQQDKMTKAHVKPTRERSKQKQLVSVRGGTPVNNLTEEQGKGDMLGERTAVRPVSSDAVPRTPISTIESHFGSDFSRVPTHTVTSQAGPIIQPQSTVNVPGGQYEREADQTAETGQTLVTQIGKPRLISNTVGQWKRKPEVFLSGEQIISKQESTAIKGSQKNIQEDFSFSFEFGNHVPFDMDQDLKLSNRFEKYATDNDLDFSIGSKLWAHYRAVLGWLYSNNKDLGLPARAIEGMTYEYEIKVNVKGPKARLFKIKLVNHPELRPIPENLSEEIESKTEENEKTSEKITCEITECSRKTTYPYNITIKGEATNANGGTVSVHLAQAEGCDVGTKSRVGHVDVSSLKTTPVIPILMPPFTKGKFWAIGLSGKSSSGLGPGKRIIVEVRKKGKEPGYCCARIEQIP